MAVGESVRLTLSSGSVVLQDGVTWRAEGDALPGIDATGTLMVGRPGTVLVHATWRDATAEWRSEVVPSVHGNYRATLPMTDCRNISDQR